MPTLLSQASQRCAYYKTPLVTWPDLSAMSVASVPAVDYTTTRTLTPTHMQVPMCCLRTPPVAPPVWVSLSALSG